MKQLITFLLLTSSLLAQQVIRVNVGGPQYTDTAGAVYSADYGCDGDTFASIVPVGSIAGTSNPTLYMTGRKATSSFSCSYSVPDGIYLVNLKFAEVLGASSGQRIFNTFIQGQRVLSQFDVTRLAGTATAYDRQFVVRVLGDSPLTILLSQTNNAPILQAIEIIYLYNVAEGSANPDHCSQGQLFYRTDTQLYYGCFVTDTWSLLTGGGSSGPPPSSAQLGDFWVVRTSPTVLTIGPACSTTFPCKVAFGTSVFTLTTPATATISAGTDTAYIYVSDAQVLTVGVTSATFTCSGCTRVTSISAFPATSFPLWIWTSTSGVWDLVGTDQRTIVQKGADPLAYYVLTTANTQLKNSVTTLPVANMHANAKIRPFMVVSGDPDSASPVLVNGNDAPATVSNDYGQDLTITGFACRADAGSPTVTPILTGGSATSIVTGAVTCGTGSWAAGTINGSPVLHSFSANGSTCSSTPCTADMNITSAGGTARMINFKLVVTF